MNPREAQKLIAESEARLNVLVSVITWARDFKPKCLTPEQRETVIEQCEEEVRRITDFLGKRQIVGTGNVNR